MAEPCLPSNYDNTPDIGFQIGWAYSPAFKR